MLRLERSAGPGKPNSAETIQVPLHRLGSRRGWWIVVDNEKAEVCLKGPGKDIAVCFNCTVRTIIEDWMGDRAHREAISGGRAQH